MESILRHFLKTKQLGGNFGILVMSENEPGNPQRIRICSIRATDNHDRRRHEFLSPLLAWSDGVYGGRPAGGQLVESTCSKSDGSHLLP
jgi:hypothetical protein